LIESGAKNERGMSEKQDGGRGMSAKQDGGDDKTLLFVVYNIPKT